MPQPNPLPLIERRVAEVTKAIGWDEPIPAADPSLQSTAQDALHSLQATPNSAPFTPDHHPLLLVWASADGHTSIVRALLASGMDPNTTVSTHPKYRPVLLAARAGHLDVVRLLIDAKAYLGFGKDPLGKRAGIWSLPLAQAIMGGHNDVAVLLAQTNTVIVPVNHDAEFLVSLAAEYGVDAVIPFLVSAGYNPNTTAPLQELTPLMLASSKGHTAAVRTLLNAGADPNAPVNVDPILAKASATSALILAAKAGHRDIVELLLNAEADTAATDSRGANAYDWAKRSGHGDIAALLQGRTTSATSPLEKLMNAVEANDLTAVKRLIASGCDLEAKTPVIWPPDKPATGGQTPLMRAVELGHIQIIKALLNAGADATALSDPTEEAEITAIHYAAKAGQLDAIRILMAAIPAKQRKGDLGVTGCTPLQTAAEKGQLQSMQTLLECGASLSGWVGGNCLYKAACHGHENIARFLLKQGISPDDPGQYRYPPLSEAVREKREHMVRLLLESGANVNALSKEGWTPLNYAQYDGLDSIAAILKKAGGKLAEDLPSKPAKAPKEKPANALPKLPRQYASGKMADSPKFRITAQLQSAAKKLESATGLKREQIASRPGAFFFTIPSKDAVETVRKHQKKLLEAGCYLFVATHNLTGSEALALLPTDDVYEAIAWVGTHGANYGVGSENIIDALNDIADDNPFTLWTITHDCLEGRFTSRLRTPKSIANLFAALAPDIVTQGTNTVSALAETLRGPHPPLFLWWD